MQNIINILEAYNQTKIRFEQTLVDENIPKINNLLFNYNKMKNDYSNWNINEAINYNIFDILNIRYRETKTHTPFLVNLLKPKSTHGQRLLFYNVFLEQVFNSIPDSSKKKNLFSDISINDIEVIEEKSTILHGRIDILIQSIGTKERFAIVIENKINANDQPQQLQRYYDYCSKTLGLKNDNILLIYLTKNGKDASKESMLIKEQKKLKKANVLVNISYQKHIRKMLEESILEIKTNRVKILLEQYLNIITSIRNFLYFASKPSVFQ